MQSVFPGCSLGPPIPSSAFCRAIRLPSHFHLTVLRCFIVTESGNAGSGSPDSKSKSGGISVRSSPRSFPVPDIHLCTSRCSRPSSCPLGGSRKAFLGAEGFAGLLRPSAGNLQGRAGARLLLLLLGRWGKALKSFGCTLRNYELAKE